MRRADRLFQIVQILRRSAQPVTADAIAVELETSKRSVYRDVAALVGQRVPIRGEAGVGYVLEGGYDLPPLMLTEDEVEAAVLGAQWVAGHADPVLARAAQDLVAKIAAVMPEELRPLVENASSRAPPSWSMQPDGFDMALARVAIRAGRKMRVGYRDQDGVETTRIIWPIAIGYLDSRRLLVGWCELRKAFRTFRADRVLDAEFLEDRYPERPAVLRGRWMRQLRDQEAACCSEAREAGITAVACDVVSRCEQSSEHNAASQLRSLNTAECT